MKLRPSWKATSRSVTQEFPNWNPKFHYRGTLHWSLSWARTIQSIPFHPISKVLFNVTLPPTSRSSKLFFSFWLFHQNPVITCNAYCTKRQTLQISVQEEKATWSADYRRWIRWQNKLIWRHNWSVTSLLTFPMKTVPQLAGAQTRPFTRHETDRISSGRRQARTLTTGHRFLEGNSKREWCTHRLYSVWSGAGIAQSWQWRATGWVAVVRFPAGAKVLSLLHSVQTGCGAHPASYPMGAGGKAAGVWNWPLIFIYCWVEEWWSQPPLPYTSSWRGA
jgi:hypothetical protein